MKTPGTVPESLRTSEIRYRRLFEAARDGILLLDAVDLTITDVNPFMTELLGYPRGHFLGKELWQIGFFSDKPASQAAFQHLQESGYLRYDDLPLKTSEGKLRQVEFVSNVYDEDGEQVIQCNIRDITDRRSEGARRSSDERYRALFEYAPDGMVIADCESNYLDANANICRMLGYTRDEFIGLNASDIVSNAEIPRLGPAIKSIHQESEYNREWTFKRKDGSVFPGNVVATIMPDGNMMALIRDITEQKRAEQAVRLGPTIMLAGLAALTVLGGLEFFEQFLVDVVGKWIGLALPLVMGSATVVAVTYLALKRQESLYRRTFEEIGERKQAEQAQVELNVELDGQRERLTSIVGSVPGVVWEAWGEPNAASQQINFVSDYVEAMLGYSVKEWLATPNFWLSIVHPDDKEKTERAAAADFAKGEGSSRLEFRWLAKDGQAIWVESNSVIIADDDLKPIGLRGVTIDITQRKQAEIERRIIYEIILQGVITAPNLDEFLKLIHRTISEVMYAENCFVMLHDPATDAVHFEFWADTRDPHPPPKPRGTGFASYVLRTGLPLLLDTRSKRKLQKLGEAEQVGSTSASWLGVPLRTPLRTIGVLVLQHYDLENAYSERDLEFLASVGDQIALAIERKRADEALSESEERYRSVVETAPDVIITIDESSMICFANPATERVFGYRVDELKGTSLSTLMPEKLRPLHHKGIKRYQKTGHKHVPWDYIELTGLHKNGLEIPITLSFSEFVQNGRRYFTGIIRDISERKKATEALQESEKRYRDLVENALDMIYTHDLDGNYLSVNAAGEKITGYTADETLSMGLADAVAPDYLEKARQMVAAKIAGQEVAPYELELIARDGNRIPVEVNTRIIEDGGTPVAVQGIARDLTGRKQAEEARRASEDRLRIVTENARVGLAMLDTDRCYTFANAAYSEMLGLGDIPLIGKNVADVLAPVYEQQIRPRLDRAFGGERIAFERHRATPDGEAYFSVKYEPTKSGGKISSVVAVITDVTEVKQSAEKMRQSEDKLAEAQRQARIGSWSLDLNDRVLLWSDEHFRIFGLAPGEIDTIYEGIVDKYVHKNDRDMVRKVIEDACTTLEPFDFYYRIVHDDESEHIVHSRGSVIADTDGKAIRLLGTAQDVTEQRRAEEALIVSEQRYRDLVENAIDIIYTHDLKGNYLSINKAGERIMGYTVKEALSMNLTDAVAPEYLAKVNEVVAEKLAGKDVTAYELEVIAKDGHHITVEVNTRIIEENGVPVAVQGIARDITERKHLADQLRQSQKMEAIGLLAGGIAHDFNNLLTAISGYSSLALKKLSMHDPLRGNIVEIKNAGERAAALTAQLLAFSRKQMLKPRVHNLNAVLADVEKMLRRIIRENIDLRTVLDPDLGNIKADPGQIEQVIMNLVVNARDAMPEGGRLIIETKNIYIDKKYVNENLAVTPGPFVQLTITDTGKGIDSKTQQRIFEPFFTTKEIGKGTGLGLSTVHGIVRQSGGDILVYSEIGHGTTFKVYLPCVDENIQRPKWHYDDMESLAGTETILVVEDEDVVRNLVSTILTSNGYKVLTAATGKAALAVLQTHTETIDMLLTDLIMPGMSGIELKTQCEKRRPGIKILFMSGYTDQTMVQHGVLDAKTAFIEKPFSPDGLARRVREVFSSGLGSDK